MPRSNRRAFARPDCIAVLACAGICVTLVAATQPALRNSDRDPRSMEDMKRLRDIIIPFAIYAEEGNGGFPRPGLIGQGGKEDPSLNTTANLYAALIAQRYIAPEAIVSPIERNPHVKIDRDFDFDAYNPNDGIFWDSSFTADLETEANCSYAHLPMFGARAERQWRGTADAHFPLFANRGPREGGIDPDSITCDPHGVWSGNVLFADGHVEYLRSMTMDKLTVEVNGRQVPDNLFRIDDGIRGGDAVLSFTKAMTDAGPRLQYD